MKIMFVWRRMDRIAGGVERMVATMMNEMVRRGHDVFLLTWDQEQAEAYYHIDPAVKWHRLAIGNPETKSGWAIRIKRMFKLRKIIRVERPDVILAFESGVFFATYIFLLGFGIPMIAAERNAPERHDFSDKRYKKHIVFNILRFAHKITVQFERYRDGYPAYLRDKIVCIHNPVNRVYQERFFVQNSAGSKRILCVARPSYQKNIDSLIDAFFKIHKDFPNWSLDILGDGEETEKLKVKIFEKGLQYKIHVLGATKDVQKEYFSSHLFCLPSRYEGFPNALAEAMACGMPAIGYKGCAGVSDLIKHGKTGLLADGNGNPDTLGEMLAVLMRDDFARESYGSAARQAMAAFDPILIFDQWEKLFLGTASNR